MDGVNGIREIPLPVNVEPKRRFFYLSRTGVILGVIIGVVLGQWKRNGSYYIGFS